MSTLEVNKITPVSGGTTVQVGESGDTINIPSGATITNSGTANNFTSYRPNAKPLIINGNMAVSQRGTSFSPSGSSTTMTTDRFAYDVTGSGTGDATITQEADAPASTNLRKSLKISPDATETLSGGENIVFTTSLEGQDVQVLGHGTSSPPKATLSFWVKSSKTGTYCVQIKEEGVSNESYLLYEYSISSANTWEQKIFSWTGNTAHTLNDDNVMGFRIVWHLAVGSDDHASATTSWTEATAFKATSNQVNFFDSTSNDWYLTGVQLEVGEYTSSTLPPFQHESYGDNFARCCRYYWENQEDTAQFPYQEGSVFMYQNRIFPVAMRAAPTATVTFAANAGSISSSTVSSLGKNSAILQVNTASTGGRISCTSEKYSAEL
jgi:hypothetical protein